jgi:transcriptional regulator with XRE-family HTH domain
MSVSKRVREIRSLLSIKDFAEKLEISASAISNIENGTKNLSIKLARKISALYNVSVDWLYEGDKQEIVQVEALGEYVPLSKYVQILEENSRLKDLLLEKQQRELDYTKNIKDVSK